MTPPPDPTTRLKALSDLLDVLDEEFENARFVRALRGGKPQDDEPEAISVRLWEQYDAVAMIREVLDAHAQQAEEIARWREAAYFAAKARNLRALRDRVAAGEAVTAVAEDYRVPAEWVTAITHPGWDLLSGDAALAGEKEHP